MVKGLQPGDPQTIGPYRLVGQLGSGGMGRVFLGVSAGGRPVAVKVVRAELAADPEFRNRFGREVAAARRVSGMFTAMVVDADIDGPVAWLATAYVPGPSLAEAIKDHGPLPASSLLTLAAGLAESLSAIHAAGVVHRDLKPSNVLIAQDGPRVIDFGISRAAESTQLTQAGLVIGSPGFMSPEQAAGYEVGPPSDIFSLGAVLAFAATGEGPFGTGTTAALLYRVVHGDPALDRVPSDVRPLIERCLAKDPGRRPTADGLLAEVGALQPTPDWLPDSIIRAFAPDPAAGPAPATAAKAAAPAAAPGSLAALGSVAALGIAGDAATQTTAAGAAAQVPSGESLLLAPAGDPPTATSKSMPPAGDTYPPGSAYRQPPPSQPPPGASPGQPPPGGSRPQRRLWRPMVLVWIIAGMIAAGIAGFAVTSFTGGSTPAPGQSPAGLTSSAATSTAGGRGAPGVSGSASSSSAASRSASSLGERRSVIVPGHIAAGDRACLRIPAYLPAGERVRVPEPPLVRLPVPDPGLTHLQGPDPDADHISTDTDTDHLSTDIAEHTHVGHVGGHSIIRIGTRVWVAAPGEKGLRLVKDRAGGLGVGSEDEMAQRLNEGPFVVDSQVERRFGVPPVEFARHECRDVDVVDDEVADKPCPGPYPARAGGPWLCSTFVLSLFHAVVVPSGFSTRVQPQRWITTWWW